MTETYTIGSLCTGYGGLDLAVEAHFGARTAWVSDVEPAACEILDARFPGVPNLGDLTAVDWATVEPVDILTAGYPCQPFSQAGKRKGAKDVRHLWPHIAHAVDVLRPRWCVFENVQGHLTLGGLEVVDSLTSMGYSVRWGLVRASDAGAPHRRARLFVAAHTADTGGGPFPGVAGEAGAGLGWGLGGDADPRAGVTLLPTPAVNDMGAGKTVQQWDEWTDAMRAKHGNGNGHGKSLSIEAQRLLPTPRATDGTKGGPNQRGSSGDLMLPSAVQPAQWGQYGAAIERWEHVIGRPAPAPTEPTGRDGGPRLNPAMVEWMMGLPEGWVTGLGLTRNAQLKALGNGVVPQQAELALQLLASAT